MASIVKPCLIMEEEERDGKEKERSWEGKPLEAGVTANPLLHWKEEGKRNVRGKKGIMTGQEGGNRVEAGLE